MSSTCKAVPKRRLKVLITVKTYPIPSQKYDELVCTAGVTETGEFIRLYPVNFRELPYHQQYRKYQWIEVEAEKHGRSDVRKESYRPDCGTLRLVGEPIPTRRGDWTERAQYVLAGKTRSLEELKDRQKADRTSLGVFKPKRIEDLVYTSESPQWKPAFLQNLKQARLFEERQRTLQPPRKLPYKFQYVFTCDDTRCRGHKLLIEDWELGALFWNLVDAGDTHPQAAAKVRDKYLSELCGPDKDTHLFVGTVAAHPLSWVVIGVFYPKRKPRTLFDT